MEVIHVSRRREIGKPFAETSNGKGRCKSSFQAGGNDHCFRVQGAIIIIVNLYPGSHPPTIKIRETPILDDQNTQTYEQK